VRRRRATANRVLTYLKAALNHAWRSGIVPSDDAWRRVKPFKSVDSPVVRYLSHDEITRLLNGCQGAFRDLVHAALLTGCRYGELCQLKVADYNPDVRTLTIRHGKGGQVRHVTLTDEAPELIERLIAARSPREFLLRRDDVRAWKRAEQLRPMREACACRNYPRSWIPRAAPHPRLSPSHAGRADDGDRPTARTCRHPHDGASLCTSRAKLRCRYYPGKLSAVNIVHYVGSRLDQ
jgi:integrase